MQIKVFFLIFLLSAMLCGCSEPSENKGIYTLLNESDIQKIHSVIGNDDNNGEITSLNLFKYKDNLTYVRINRSDISVCYSLDGNICDIDNNNSNYEIFVGTTVKGSITEEVDMLCGNYNGYIIAREVAEYELGENFVNLYYDNFCPENPAYEAIASDKNEQLYLIGDDCFIPITGFEIDARDYEHNAQKYITEE